MADYRDEHDAGGGFMMGLLTGTVLGAGIGMLLAPKSGGELRHQIGEQASSLGRRASGAVNDMTERARETLHRGGEQMRGRGGDTGDESTRSSGFGSGVGLASTDTSMPGSGYTAGTSPGSGGTGSSTYTGTIGGFDPDRP